MLSTCTYRNPNHSPNPNHVRPLLLSTCACILARGGADAAGGAPNHNPDPNSNPNPNPNPNPNLVDEHVVGWRAWREDNSVGL